MSKDIMNPQDSPTPDEDRPVIEGPVSETKDVAKKDVTKKDVLKKEVAQPESEQTSSEDTSSEEMLAKRPRGAQRRRSRREIKASQGKAQGTKDAKTTKASRSAEHKATLAEAVDAPASSEPLKTESVRSITSEVSSPARRTSERAPQLPAAQSPVSPSAVAQSPAPQKRARRLGAIVTSGVLGVVLVGALASVAAAENIVSLPVQAGPVTPAPQVIPAGTLRNVCPAAPRVLSGTGDGTDAQFRADSTQSSFNLSGTVMSDFGGNFPTTELIQTDNSQVLKQIAKADPSADEAPEGQSKDGYTKLQAKPFGDFSAPESVTLTADPANGQSPFASALVSYRASDGDLQGLAAQNCTAPSNDQWLIGASTSVGVTSILSLTNPSNAPASVNVSLFAEDGPVNAAGARGITVAPGATKSLVLAGLAPNKKSLAVEVQSTGAPVAASIQTSVLRGLTPGGVDVISPISAAATQTAITGIKVQSKRALKDFTSQQGYGDAGNELYLYASGATDATVTLSITGESGAVNLGDRGVVSVPAGKVVAYPLDQLDEGTYSVNISSDSLVVAGARAVNSNGKQAASDLEFLAASPQLGAQQLVNIPRGIDAVLSFSSGSASANVRLSPVLADGSVGSEKTVATSADSTTLVKPADVGKDVQSILVSADGAPAFGSLVLSAPNAPGIAAIPVLPVAGGNQQVPVQIAP